MAFLQAIYDVGDVLKANVVSMAKGVKAIHYSPSTLFALKSI
jgi:hypothetical protein